jgi:hypothetical protein
MSNMRLHVPYRNGHPPVNASSCGHVRDKGHLTIARDPLDCKRRRGHTRIPDDLTFLLSTPQSTALPGIQYAGWDICFLRERPFMDPEVVIHNREDGRFGILDIDGLIRLPDELRVRKQTPQDPLPEIHQAQNHTYITV